MSPPAHTRATRQHGRHPIIKPREMDPASRLGLEHPGTILQRAALAPASLRPADILRLQQTIGNRAVARLLSQLSPARSLIQAKLTVNAPGDKYELEADRMAEQVMRMPAVQGQDVEAVEKLNVMTKPQPSPAAGDAFEAGEDFEQQLRASRGQGQPLPPTLREEFETKFGTDLGGVKIHSDRRAAEMNQHIQAKAFTHGDDIYLGPNPPDLRSAQAKPLLAHELTHVMQQRAINARENHLIQRRVGFEFENIGIRLVKGDLEKYKKDLERFNKRYAWDTAKNLAEKFFGKIYPNLKRKEEVIKETYFTLEADDTAGSNVEFVLHGDRVNALGEEKAGFTFQQREQMSTAAEEASVLAKKIDNKKKGEPFSAAEILSTAAPKDVIVHKLHDMPYLFQATAGIRLDRITRVFSEGETSDLFKGAGAGFSRHYEKAAEAAIDKVEVPEHARSIELTNLLTLVIRYIQGARAFKEGENIKEITPMMARTDFGTLYSLLPDRTKNYFTEDPERWVELVNSASGKLEGERGHEQFSETNITEWLRGMPSGKDTWKGLDPDEAMGGLGERTDPGNPKEETAPSRQPIFEFRHMRPAHPSTFVKDCQEFFDYVAKLNDERGV
jgi:hypothetical protein